MPKIITRFVDPPIPTGFEWFAFYEGDEPNEEGCQPTGYGSTEQAAIENLKAEHPRDDESDPLLRLWVCLPCGTKTEFGQMLAADVMRCPKCRSHHIEPADGARVMVKDSNWAIPPVTN